MSRRAAAPDTAALPHGSSTAPPAAPARRTSDGVLRVATAVVGLPLVVGAAWVGGAAFAGLVALAALAAQAEVYRLARAAGAAPDVGIGLAAGACVALAPLWPDARLAALALVAVALARVAVRAPRANPVLGLAATLGGLVYPTALLSTLTALRLDLGARLDPAEAAWATLAIFLLVAVTDTAAYYTGRALGKTPLAPSVSPKKTWEGAAGGAVAAVLAALALSATLVPSVPLWAMLALGALAGVVSPLGDLAESRLKRAVGVKDSGRVLPGHGGVLDRIDALLVAAPLAYVVLTLAMRG